MHDRRASDRRVNPAVPEPLQRRSSRRAGERRESVRFSIGFELVPEGDMVAGELGLGGASYWAPTPPKDDLRGVRTVLAGVTYWLPMRVLSVARERDGFCVHLGFMELPVQAELAIARWLDETSIWAA